MWMLALLFVTTFVCSFQMCKAIDNFSVQRVVISAAVRTRDRPMFHAMFPRYFRSMLAIAGFAALLIMSVTMELLVGLEYFHGH